MPKLKKGLWLILGSLVPTALFIIIMSFGGRIEIYMGVDIGRILLLAIGTYFIAYSFQMRFNSILFFAFFILCDGIETVLMGLISFLMSNHYPTEDLPFYALVANTGGYEIIGGGVVILVVILLNWAFPRGILR